MKLRVRCIPRRSRVRYPYGPIGDERFAGAMIELRYGEVIERCLLDTKREATGTREELDRYPSGRAFSRGLQRLNALR